MIRKTILILVLLFLFSSVIPNAVYSFSEDDFESKAILLMEHHTGEIVVSFNMQEKVYPASTTKIMTLLLALEALSEGEVSLDDEVPITERAASMGGSQLFLSAGDVIDMESLLIGITVGSGNDASVAVAEYLAGSEEAFVDRMNQRAEKLGMDHTHFVNSNGLHDDQHYSTAYDIALMSRELLAYPIFFRWSQIWMDEHFLEGRIQAGRVFLSNTNRLIRYYQGCDGVKTGYTRESGHSISASAERNGTRFIAVVMGAPNSDTRYEEAKYLLDYGFLNYYSVVLVPRNKVVASLPVDRGNTIEIDVVALENLSLLVKKNEGENFEIEYNLPARLEAPLEKGHSVGTAKALFQDQAIKEIDLVLADDIFKVSFPQLLSRYLEIWLRFIN